MPLHGKTFRGDGDTNSSNIFSSKIQAKIWLQPLITHGNDPQPPSSLGFVASENVTVIVQFCYAVWTIQSTQLCVFNVSNFFCLVHPFSWKRTASPHSATTRFRYNGDATTLAAHAIGHNNGYYKVTHGSELSTVRRSHLLELNNSKDLSLLICGSFSVWVISLILLP